eukprot:1191559-Prorocentrum_minimum.AAC.2
MTASRETIRGEFNSSVVKRLIKGLTDMVEWLNKGLMAAWSPGPAGRLGGAYLRGCGELVRVELALQRFEVGIYVLHAHTVRALSAKSRRSPAESAQRFAFCVRGRA